MEKNATIAAMKVAQKEREKEAFAQNKGYKFADWFKTKAIPGACNAGDEFFINDKIKVTKKGKIKITKIGYFFDCQK